MKTTHQLAAELLALPNVRVAIEGWMASKDHDPVATMTEYDPHGTAIIVQKPLIQEQQPPV